jgi:2-C-methyl-D-erythritol 4-phosphate cytidylyltransferase
MLWGAVILAAGRGERFGKPKQLIDVAGLPLLGWCVRTFAAMPEISDAVIVCEPEWIEAVQRIAAQLFRETPFTVVPGGPTLQASAERGLEALPDRCPALFVHDGARPLVRASDVRAGMAQTRDGHAALLAAPIVDTVKVVDPAALRVLRTLDRETLWAAQTPQFAMANDLRRAHAQAKSDGVVATDETMLLERVGVEVRVVASSGDNFKVTVPEDLARAEWLLRERLEHAPREEEVLLVEVFADANLVDVICAELEARGATIDGVERDLPRGAAVRAFVPAENLRGFGERFEGFADGSATYVTRFSHYAGRGEQTAGAR